MLIHVACGSVHHRIPFACFPRGFSSDVSPKEICPHVVIEVLSLMCCSSVAQTAVWRFSSGAAAQWAGLSDKRVAAGECMKAGRGKKSDEGRVIGRAIERARDA